MLAHDRIGRQAMHAPRAPYPPGFPTRWRLKCFCAERMIVTQRRIGSSSGSIRSWMLRATPGVRLIHPSRSRVSTI